MWILFLYLLKVSTFKSMKQINILVVDDESGIRRLIKDFLKRENINVIEAVDGQDAMLKFYEHENNLSLIVLDVMMPYLDGFEVLKKIRETSNIPVIMLTAKIEEESQIQGFDLGADDYVLKPFSPMVLVSRIKNKLKDQIKNETIIGNLKIDYDKRKIFVNDKEEYCTPKEYELIDYLVTNIDKAISRDELLEKIWGEKNEDSRTVDTHIKQIRAKLTDANIDIQTVRGFGYMLVKKNE